MSRSFDFILGGASLIIGILLMTGHGDFFMKGGNTQLRKAKYDEKKMAKGSGLALILIGIITFIDSYTTTVAAKDWLYCSDSCYSCRSYVVSEQQMCKKINHKKQRFFWEPLIFYGLNHY